MHKLLHWVVGVGVAFLILAATLSQTVRPSPEARTVARIRECYAALADTNNLERLGLCLQEGYDLPSALAMMLHTQGLELAITSNIPAGRHGTSALLDAWREPLMVYWKTNLSPGAAQGLRKEHSVLIIWSKGPNRSNEWGAADDIFLRGQ